MADRSIPRRETEQAQTERRLAVQKDEAPGPVPAQDPAPTGTPDPAAPDKADRPMHPAMVRLLRYFTYDHLPPDRQSISKQCCDLAHAMAEQLKTAHDTAEVTVGLRKLLEAKDCFVRSTLK